ncbi:hypothetical protein E3P91_02287 [Wallemia ichthyophaga]|nr:hypothetical protein E3P91_02287 [Wallemia ichthyophaga]
MAIHTPKHQMKPDITEFRKHQDAYKSQIDDIQGKLQIVRQKISNASANGPAHERRKALFKELDEHKSNQAGNRASRDKVLERVRVLHESTQRKVKDLQSSKSKIPFSSVGDIDSRIDHLNASIESGQLRLADEKRSLQEITNLRRQRKLVDGFAQQQHAIDADRAQVEALKAHLDDPEHKALAAKSEAISKGLNETRAEMDHAQASKQTLFDQRNKLQSDLDAVYAEKRSHSETHREGMDAYYAKVNEDKARRAQRAKEEREAENAQKAKLHAEQLREDAKLPAFEPLIQDCQTLIDQFGRIGGVHVVHNHSDNAEGNQGIQGANTPLAQHNIRQVDNQVPGGTLLKKKEDEDDAYFVGGGKSKKKERGQKKTPAKATSEDKVHVPLATLTALIGLSIPPPKSYSDIESTISSLEIKKAWYEANQEKQTKENIDKAEKEIEKILSKNKKEQNE